MDQVQMLLAGLLGSLADNPFVQPVQVRRATEHVADLIRGFQAVLEEARAQRQAAEAAARGVPPHRVDGKQPPPAPAQMPYGTMVRHAGKQHPKRLVTDHFKVIRKIAKVEPTPAGAGSAMVRQLSV